MAGPYELFKTDDDLETGGVVLNYGEFKIRIARAGGANKKYSRVLESKSRPHRRAIQAGTLDESTDLRLFAEVYAEAVVLGWSRVVKGKDGKESEVQNELLGPDGEEIPFTKENVIKVLLDLPDLFSDIREQSTKVSTFRREAERETDAKN